MKNLKQLCLAACLTIIFATAVPADCPTPVPGELSNPPCTSTQQLTDEPVDQTTASTTATVSSEVEVVFVDAVIAGMENLLTVY